MSAWFPAFQRRHTIFVVGLLALALALSPLAPALPLAAQLTILALAVVVFGLPHGALDLALVQGASRGSWTALAAAIAVYLVASAAVLAVWITAPVAALLGFLAIAVIHFGLGDTEDLTDRNARWKSSPAAASPASRHWSFIRKPPGTSSPSSSDPPRQRISTPRWPS